jgi:AraC-like DNA-binding protein
LSDLDAQASLRERVRSVLLDMLPAGQSSIDGVAQRLAMSKRSLQRQLAQESLGFQDVLNQVRQELARHYLSRTELSAAEIAWLLGFQESNSFVRAFRGWTGATPSVYRKERVAVNTHWH